jgi:sec-independent protein translocase protein TatA
MYPTLPMQFGLPGGPELLIILFIAVLLFGANKLPKLARASGEAMGEFKRGRQELEAEIERGASDVEGTPSDAGGSESESNAGVETAERPGETEAAS